MSRVSCDQIIGPYSDTSPSLIAQEPDILENLASVSNHLFVKRNQKGPVYTDQTICACSASVI